MAVPGSFDLRKLRRAQSGEINISYFRSNRWREWR
jgi:hypothetical protein